MMCAEIYSLKSISYNYIVSFSDVARDLLNIMDSKEIYRGIFYEFIVRHNQRQNGGRWCKDVSLRTREWFFMFNVFHVRL